MRNYPFFDNRHQGELNIEKKRFSRYRVVDNQIIVSSLENYMKNQIFSFFIILVLLFSISGCYSKPVRHLASDIALIKVGTSTEEDVEIFLGEPDEKQELDGGVVKWLYIDKNQTLMQKTPLIGKQIGAPVFHRAVVTLQGGIVTDTTYSVSDEDEMDWTDDYSWQVKKK